jgi:hypothetical protein
MKFVYHVRTLCGITLEWLEVSADALKVAKVERALLFEVNVKSGVQIQLGVTYESQCEGDAKS